MVRFRILCVAILALSTVAVVAIPAGAASSPSAKFCAAAAKIGSGNNSGQPTPKQAAKTYKQFQAAAKYAPKKVKSAGKNIASLLKKVADINPSNVTDLAKFYTSGSFKGYAKAVVTFFTYSARCTS
jgi:spermidine/putrescine-binding protein